MEFIEEIFYVLDVYKNKLQNFNFCIVFLFTFVISYNIKNEIFRRDISWKILKTDWLIFLERKI